MTGRTSTSRRFQTIIGATLLVSLCLVPRAQAEVTVEGTRVVFAADKREVGVRLKNEGERASLVQAWVADEGDLQQTPEASAAPFIIDRPLLRLDPGASHALRIRGISARLPTDNQEHLYWLNVVDVPPRQAKAGDNVVQLAIRFRMKLLYRPQGLGAPVNPDGQVSMAAGADGLALRNAARHYFNLAGMTLVSASGERAVDAFYLAPGESRTLALPEGFAGPLTAVRYEWVDDDGVLHAVTRTL